LKYTKRNAADEYEYRLRKKELFILFWWTAESLSAVSYGMVRIRTVIPSKLSSSSLLLA
jgi:hypothetical protein